MLAELTTVRFHNDTLFAVQREAKVSVVMPPICERFGIEWSSQLKRIKRDPILAEGMVKMTIPSPGGDQETTILDMYLLPGWLFGIGINQVRPEARDVVLTYKRECYAVLYAHFFGQAAAEQPERVEATPIMPAEDPRKENIRTRRQLVSEARQTHGTNAARELWAYLGLPITPAMVNRTAPELPFTYTAVRHEADPEKEEAA